MQKPFHDPNWWMSVVVIGIVVGLIGNFLTLGIVKMLARLFPAFREWRQRRRAGLLREAGELARDIGLVLDMHLRALSLLVIWAMSNLMAMALYILFNVMKNRRVFLRSA